MTVLLHHRHNDQIQGELLFICEINLKLKWRKDVFLVFKFYLFLFDFFFYLRERNKSKVTVAKYVFLVFKFYLFFI